MGVCTRGKEEGEGRLKPEDPPETFQVRGVDSKTHAQMGLCMILLYCLIKIEKHKSNYTWACGKSRWSNRPVSDQALLTRKSCYQKSPWKAGLIGNWG